MRLVRIELLANDERMPDNVRTVFAKIFTDEKFHAKAFESLASEDAMVTMKQHHDAGLVTLGLAI